MILTATHSTDLDLKRFTKDLTEEEATELIDGVEAQMAECDPIECPLVHRHTPPLYSRQLFMPAGAFITSRIHKTCHQYVIPAGKVMVWERDKGWELIEAPHVGITQKGTRRVLLVLESTVWITFHCVEGNTIAELEANLFDNRINPLIPHAKLPQFQQVLADG